MTHLRGLATTPTPLFWTLAVLFGIPGLYDVLTGLTTAPLVEVMASVSGLALGAFMLYCALKAGQGKRAELASPRMTTVGYVLMGVCALCFLLKITSTAVTVYA